MLININRFNYIIAFGFLISATYVFYIIPFFEYFQKLLILIIALLAILKFGLIKRKIFLALFFSISVFFSATFGFFINEDFDVVRLLISYPSFLIIFLLFATNFDYKSQDNILLGISLLPILSILIGLIGFLWNRPPWGVEYTGAFRLRGGTIAAHLAMLGTVSVYSLLLLIKKYDEANRKYYILLFLSICIVVLTATRGALIACCIALLPMFFNILKKLNPIKIFGIFSILTILGFYIAKVLEIRNAQALDSEEFNASGRLVAWEFFYEKILDYPLWGWGLGAVTKLTENEDENNLRAFVVPHNEYIRFVVDLGFIGGGFFLFSLIFFLVYMSRFVSYKYKGNYYFILTSFMVYSFVDNLISTFQYAIPFFLLLNIMTSRYFKGKRFL